jgi:DNA-binding CsgD family transcriptional regulator
MTNNTLSAIDRPPVLSAPGLILVDTSSNQLFYNHEAIEILAYPNRPTNLKRIGPLLAEKISDLLKRSPKNNSDFVKMTWISGRRNYLCSRYILNLQGLQGLKTILFLLQRQSAPETPLQENFAGLHLTQREKEAVGLLVRGLTSKEIAQHMGISPNTVKSFLRLVMTKAGVSTRTGLIGRVAGLVPRSQATSATTGHGSNLRLG